MDPEEIFKKTYIAPKIIRALIEEDFKKLSSKSKALGFIKILEKQLELDLTELRQKVEEYYEDKIDYQNAFAIEEKGIERHTNPFLKIFLFIIILIAGIYLYFDKFAPKEEHKAKKEFFAPSKSSLSSTLSSQSSLSSVNSSLQNSSASVEALEEKRSQETPKVAVAQEVNGTQEANRTQNMVQVVEENIAQATETNSTQEELAITPSITIIPKRKLWVGIIYLDNYKRKNYLTSSPIELNISRDQLIVTGHGMLQIDINGEIQDLSEKGKQRFLYRAGELERIDRKTFKQYNRGKDW